MNTRHVPYLVAFGVAVAGAVCLAQILSVTVERPAMHALRAWYRQGLNRPRVERQV
jgi:hypothetical protein